MNSNYSTINRVVKDMISYKEDMIDKDYLLANKIAVKLGFSYMIANIIRSIIMNYVPCYNVDRDIQVLSTKIFQGIWGWDEICP